MTTQTITGTIHHIDSVITEWQTLLDENNLMKIVNKTAAYTITSGDELIRCNGTFAVTLPPATGSRQLFAIKNIGVGTITLTPDGTDLIDGAVSYSLANNETVVVCDSASGIWDVI